MGVFDTVAAINRPNLVKENRKPASDVVFESHTISPLVKEAIHLLSLDERRIAFFPTLMNQDDRVTEIWFAGAHSDVGSGFHYDGLSDISLQFLLDECVRRNLGLKILPPRAISYPDLFPDDKDEMIQYRDVIVQPNHMGRSHQQHAMTFIKESFLEDRTPRVNVNDRRSIFPPVIHHSVFDRMVDDPHYDPLSLRYHMVNPYTGGTVPFNVWYVPDNMAHYTALDDAKLAAMHRPVGLEIGEERRFIVYANQHFSSSRVLVEKEGTYRFRIDEAELWFDGPIEATARGWKEKSEKKHLSWYQKLFVKLAEDHRRHPDARWFEAIGAVNRSDAHQVRILSFLDGEDNGGWTPGVSGEFFAYPNDLKRKYGNNLGTIQVTIIRTA